VTAMTSRREFVREVAGAVLGGATLRQPTRQPAAFRGARAAEERTVEGVALRWCPPGRFTMGSPLGEAGRRSDEGPVEVTLTRGFWTAAHEATQGQWRRVVGAFPDRPPTAQFGEGGEFPMYWVNFHEAEDFCARLTERASRSGALPAGWAFTLPTEAQWEYACRAGTTTVTAFGDTLDLRHVNFNGELLDRTRVGPTPGRATRVGSYPPNAWGIHDMHGNVWEWCQDWYHARLPGGTDPDLRDVPGARNGDGTYSRVRRGGAWIEPGWACRSACRLRYEPPRRSDHIGFRVVVAER
jgi:formylglycine-generating enzyme